SASLPPPRPLPPPFPYTTLFRSLSARRCVDGRETGRFSGHRAGGSAGHVPHRLVGDRGPRGGPLSQVVPQAVPGAAAEVTGKLRSEEHTSELQSRVDLVCRLLLE